MKLLAIETCSDACSAALLIDGEINSEFQRAPQKHSELILPMCERLLASAQLDRSQLDVIAFSRGPGSFTGVRIGTSVAQGMAFALDLPVVPVSTLAVVAQHAFRLTNEQTILVLMDARMREVYAGLYQLNELRVMAPLVHESLCTPEDVAKLVTVDAFGAGNAWQEYQTQLDAKNIAALTGWRDDILPHAHDVAVLGQVDFLAGKGLAAEHALPVYLRNNVVQSKKSG